MRARVWILAVAVAVGGAAAYFLGRDEAGPEPEPLAEEPAPPPPAPQEEQRDFDWALKAFLDPDGNAGASRRILYRIVDQLRSQGRDLLAHIAELRSAVYHARSFPEPPLAKRHLPKDSDFHEVGTTVSVVTAGPLRFTLSLPKSYLPQDPKRLVDTPPTPLIVTLHEKQDYRGPKGAIRFPGEEALKRRYDPAGPSKAVLKGWAVLAPVATLGKWVGEDGIALMKDWVAPPLRETWTRYHVDFDRIVIDGGSEALLIAASRPYIFAGVIVRGDEADVAPDIVRNFAHMPVYVVGSDASAAVRTLLANGFAAERVKIGGPEGLAAWLKGVKRTTPKSFHWTMKDREMTVANWVVINSTETGPDVVPMLDVWVVDTAEHPNTIKIRSKAVRGIALLLNDDIVDLNREVRVVVNGEPVTAAQIPDGKENQQVKLPAKLERSWDTAFVAPPLRVRKNLQYGMLFSVILDGIKIPGDDPAAAPPPDPGAAPADPAAPGPQDEAEAKRKFEKAEGYEKDGNLEIAKRLYVQVVALGATTYKDRAEAKLKELEAKGAAPK